MQQTKPKYGVPADRFEREQVLCAVSGYAAEHQLVPPLSMEELRDHAEKNAAHPGLVDYVMVLLNNEVWRDTVASIPYERRLLLLPQSLRNRQPSSKAPKTKKPIAPGSGIGWLEKNMLSK